MSWTVLFEKSIEDNAHNKKQANQEILSKSGDPAPTTPNTPDSNMFPANEPSVKTTKSVKKRPAGGDVAGKVEQTDKEHATSHNTGAMGSHGKKTTAYVTEGAGAKKAGIALALAGATNPAGNVPVEGATKDSAPSDGGPIAAKKAEVVKGQTAFPGKK